MKWVECNGTHVKPFWINLDAVQIIEACDVPDGSDECHLRLIINDRVIRIGPTESEKIIQTILKVP